MYCDFLKFFVFDPRSSSFSVERQKRYATSSHVQMTSFVNVCDVKSAEKRYPCFKIVNNKTKIKKTCVSSHRCLGSPVVKKKEFQLKGFISTEEINLSRQKQNYGLYLFDKSWYLLAKHVIYNDNMALTKYLENHCGLRHFKKYCYYNYVKLGHNSH